MANFSLLAKLGLDTKAYQKGLKNAQGKTNLFVAAIKKLGPVVTAVGLTSLAKQAIDLGSRLSDLAIKLNISVEALQTLRFASQEAGTKAEVLNRAIRNVQLRTEEAAKGVTSYADAFTVLGISVSDFKKLPIEQRFVAIANALKNAEDKQAAYNAVSRILGEKAGPELMEVLKRLSDEGFDGIAQSAKDAGQVMSEETARRLDIFADRIEKVKTAFVIAAANITAKFLPVLYVLEGVIGVIGAAFGGLTQKVGSFVGFIAEIGNSLTKPFTSIADSLFLVFEAINSALRGNLPKARKLIEDAKNKIADSFEELKDVPKDVAKAYEKANDKMAKSSIEVDRKASKAIKNMKKSLASLGKTAKETAKEVGGVGTTGGGATGGLGGTGADKTDLERMTRLRKNLLEAQASQDEARIAAAKAQLDLEARIQKIMKDTNVSRAEALEIARQMQQIGSGADFDQSGYVTPREQRRFEREQRKRDRERRRQEREERSREIEEEERRRKEERDRRMEERERESGFGPGFEKQNEQAQQGRDKVEKSDEGVAGTNQRLDKINQTLEGKFVTQ